MLNGVPTSSSSYSWCFISSYIHRHSTGKMCQNKGHLEKKKEGGSIYPEHWLCCLIYSLRLVATVALKMEAFILNTGCSDACASFSGYSCLEDGSIHPEHWLF